MSSDMRPLAGFARRSGRQMPEKSPVRAGAGRAAQAPARAATTPYHCATYGHYFQRRYSNRWRCAQCGVLSDVVPTDDED